MFQLKWMIESMKGFRGKFVFALLSTAVLAFMAIITPTITARIVDEVVMKLPTAENIAPLIELLYELSFLTIAFTLARSGLRYISLMLYEYCSQKFIFKIREELYAKLQSQDLNFYSKNRTGDLMTRLTGDLDMCRHTIAFVIRNLVDCILLFAINIIYMFTLNVLFAIAMVALTPIMYIASRSFSKKIKPLFVDLREKRALLNTNVQENISGNKVVRAFAKENYEIERFDEKNSEFKVANMKTTQMWLKYFPIIEGLSQSYVVVVLIAGGVLLINGEISPGTFYIFEAMSWMLVHPMRMMGMLLNDVQRFFASADKVIELYYSRPDIKNSKNPITPDKRVEGNIKFENVSVFLGKNEVLKNINLQINPGETVAIMGSTGSGKTTLINSIARFVRISSGSLTIDGNMVKDLDLHYLRSNIGIANQDVFLFSETIDGNIAYGNLDLSEDEVKGFAEMASANFVEKTESGFQTIIGERGMGLSGGQKQRIALARALAVKPSILILDDTTSAVDLETEKHIQSSLNNLSFPCTKIIVAQRISSTKNADKIIILDHGEIIEEGTHDELLKKDGYYRQVFELQNGNDGGNN